MPQEPRSNRDYGPRIAALEQGFESVRGEIHGLRQDFSGFASEMRREMAVRGRTNWSPILAGIAVLVTIIGGLVTMGAQGPLRDLARAQAASDRLVERLSEIERYFQSELKTIVNEDYKRPEAEKDLEKVWLVIKELRDSHALRGEGVAANLARIEGIVDRLKIVEQRTESNAVLASKIDGIQRDIDALRADVMRLKNGGDR